MAGDSLNDWNDLHVRSGLESVKSQLLKVVGVAPANDSNSMPPTNASAAQPSDGVWTDKFQTTQNGNVMANIYNAKLVLDFDPNFKGVLAYCSFSYRILKRKAPPFNKGVPGEWTDTDTERLRIYMAENYGFTPKSNDAVAAVLVNAEDHAFHPVQDYLTNLKWDGKKRVAMWLHRYLGVADSDYSALVGSFFLISAVARVMRPPVKVDTVLILEGLQGLGKSTLLQILFGDWFTDTPMALGEKDSFQQMQGVWGIELAELDSFNKAENTRAKQFFGSQTDRYRPSYGRMSKEFARQCVFIGTTNQDHYLKDATGNRRYWPVTCSKIDRDAITADRDQLWAEALWMFNEGYPWWVEDTHKHLFESEQDDRFESDVWEDLVREWIRINKKSEYTAAEVMAGALEMDPQAMRPPEQKRLGQILHRLGFVKKKVRDKSGKRPAFYFPPEGFWDAYKTV